MQRLMIATLPVLLVACYPDRFLTLNEFVNGDFEARFKPEAGFTYEKDPSAPPEKRPGFGETFDKGRVTWTMAAPWWIGSGTLVSPGADGTGTCLRLAPGEEASQPIGIVPDLARGVLLRGKLRTDGGKLVITVTNGDGECAVDTTSPRESGWVEFLFRPERRFPFAKGPWQIRFSAERAPVMIDEVAASTDYPDVDPDFFCFRVLQDAAMAFEGQLRHSTGTDVPHGIYGYGVRTSSGLTEHAGSVDEHSVYRLLPLMYALTGEKRWRDAALEHARFAIANCLDPKTGLPGAYDPKKKAIDPSIPMGPLEYVQMLAWAARETGDPVFTKAIRSICDAYLKHARMDDGRLCPQLYPDGRRMFPNGEEWRVYDMFPVQALAVAYDAVGEERYADAAEAATGVYMRVGQWKAWFDDPFGIGMNCMLAAHVLTGREIFLDNVRRGAAFWFDRWVNSLQHGAWCTGDDPRTWPIYCYLSSEGVAVARQHFQLVLKSQAFGGHWVEQFHLKYAAVPGLEYPLINAMNGAGTIFEHTGDRDLIVRFAAIYNDWSCFTPDESQPYAVRWGHGNTARVMGGALRMVAAIKGVPVTPYAFPLFPASPREVAKLKELGAQSTKPRR